MEDLTHQVNKYNFKIVKNRLSNAVPSLHVENDYFYIIIFHAGIYASDQNANSIYDNLTFSVTNKNLSIDIDFNPKENVICFKHAPYIYVDKIDDLSKQLQIAKQSMISLQQIIQQYFKK